jgi:hypothetical protein
MSGHVRGGFSVGGMARRSHGNRTRSRASSAPHQFLEQWFPDNRGHPHDDGKVVISVILLRHEERGPCHHNIETVKAGMGACVTVCWVGRSPVIASSPTTVIPSRPSSAFAQDSSSARLARIHCFPDGARCAARCSVD